VGGVESFLRYLATALARRHEVEVLAQRIDDGPTGRLTDSLQPPRSFEPFEDQGVRVRPLAITAARRLLMTPLLAQVVPVLRRYAYGRMRLPMSALFGQVVAPLIARAAQGANVLHVLGSDLLVVGAVRAGSILRVPVVVTPFAHRGRWGDDGASAAAYRAATRVVGLLETEAETYRDLGVPERRLEVCGVCSPGVPGGGGGRIRARFGIEGPIVLFLGVRRPYKGFELVLEAAPLVTAVRPEVTFAFLGPGPGLGSHGVRQVVDAGMVSDEDRAAWLDAADLLCLPSESEIFPVSILEAWSVRTPVLTSAIPTLEELVDRSGGGVAAPRDPGGLAGALLDLLADPTRLRAMGEAGHRFWSAHHTVEAVASWHERLYEKLAGREAAACVV
jgi:glycosyltransferase involved in cell wall biosynthesis